MSLLQLRHIDLKQCILSQNQYVSNEQDFRIYRQPNLFSSQFSHPAHWHSNYRHTPSHKPEIAIYSRTVPHLKVIKNPKTSAHPIRSTSDNKTAVYEKYYVTHNLYFPNYLSTLHPQYYYFPFLYEMKPDYLYNFHQEFLLSVFLYRIEACNKLFYNYELSWGYYIPNRPIHTTRHQEGRFHSYPEIP